MAHVKASVGQFSWLPAVDDKITKESLVVSLEHLAITTPVPIQNPSPTLHTNLLY